MATLYLVYFLTTLATFSVLAVDRDVMKREADLGRRVEDFCFFQCISDPDLDCHDKCMGLIIKRQLQFPEDPECTPVCGDDADCNIGCRNLDLGKRLEDMCFFQCLFDPDLDCHDKCMGLIIKRQLQFLEDPECTPVCGDDEDCNIRCRNLDLGKRSDN
ncbi:unnamed protein product [Lymnaea stagnalis]|uniref:Uncharacterized protein n=1 Tax=Lymnaea stagnalis TaxID=6523 RepID=A0AAV2HDL6_LYMST